MQEDMQEHQRRAERIESLIEQVSEIADVQTRTIVEELVQSLLDMYGEGLARILELTASTDEAGYHLITSFAGDKLVGSLLLLHELHPLDLETRIRQALDEVRPYLQSHGGNVELLDVEDGVARLRLQGTCNGCAASSLTLKNTIEEAVARVAPDLGRLDVEGVTDLPRTPVVAPVTFVPRRKQEEKDTVGVEKS